MTLIMKKSILSIFYIDTFDLYYICQLDKYLLILSKSIKYFIHFVSKLSKGGTNFELRGGESY